MLSIETNLKINNSKGSGFQLYLTNEPFISLEDAQNRIDEIPIYNYIIINEPANDKHGWIYQKVYSSNNEYELKEVFKLKAFPGTKIKADHILLIDEETDGGNGVYATFEDFLNTLNDFFNTY